MKPGKKAHQWEKVKRAIKPKFEQLGIVKCELRHEGCTPNLFLTWAHARKRRLLLPGELKVCALLCQNCHSFVENLGHEKMHAAVMEVISKRKAQPVEIPASAWKF